MNEQLLELARQAGLKKDHGSDREYIGDFDWREFAELIVRECAELADDGYGSTNFGNGICGAQVLKHFGVQE
jgi:hypothetical protein